MSKPKLQAPLDALESDVIETLLTGLKEWRADLRYPESHSDMQGCVRALLRMYEVKRRPIALSALPLDCVLCGGKKQVLALVNNDPMVRKTIACPTCTTIGDR